MQSPLWHLAVDGVRLLLRAALRIQGVPELSYPQSRIVAAVQPFVQRPWVLLAPKCPHTSFPTADAAVQNGIRGSTAQQCLCA